MGHRLVCVSAIQTKIKLKLQNFHNRDRCDNYIHRDRCRTTNNMLGDCYGAAVVEALSKKELEAMDKEAEVNNIKPHETCVA